MELKHKNAAANKNITCDVDYPLTYNTEHDVLTVRVFKQVISFSCRLFAKKSSRTCAVTSISTCCSGHVYRVQLGRQTTVTAGVKSGPSYRPDAAIDCSRLTKSKRARVTERNRGGPNNTTVLQLCMMTTFNKT